MKTYIQRHFTDIGRLKERDIQNVAYYIDVRYDDIKDEAKKKYDEYDKQDFPISVEYNDIIDDIKEGAVLDYAAGYWNQFEFMLFLNSLIKNYNHYLVISYNERWDGATGYEIVDGKPDIFFRDYDVSQYTAGGSVGGKSLLLFETSHDCPCGHKVLAIGLTDNEFNKLEDASFESVMTYAKKQYSQIVEV